MTTMTRTMVNSFTDSLQDKAGNMSAENRIKAKNTLSQLPLTLESINRLKGLEDVDFTPIAEEKHQQRFEDTGLALVDAVSMGVDSLEEFAQWLKAPSGSETNDIIDAAHAYVRIGKKNRPETIAGYLNDVIDNQE